MTDCFDRGCNGCDNCIDPENQAPEGAPVTGLLHEFDQLLQSAERAERYLASTSLAVSSDVYEALSHACDQGRRVMAEALAAPAPQAPVALTDEQIDHLLPEIVSGGTFTVITYGRAVARAIERAHGIPAPQTKEQP